MFRDSPRACWRLLAAVVLGLAVLTVGCGGPGACYPVSGKVTMEGELLSGKTGAVQFKPDASKGNVSTFVPVGTLGSDGNYVLTTKGKKGAPLGWYKVVITVTEPGYADVEERPHVRSDFMSEQTTPLLIEVVPNPKAGAYDLEVAPPDVVR